MAAIIGAGVQGIEVLEALAEHNAVIVAGSNPVSDQKSSAGLE
jgi:hypothetical protein